MTRTTRASSVSSEENLFDPWWRRALCAEVGPDLFFVAAGQDVKEAKKVCALCPVRAKCLTDALAMDLEYGVFGGFARPARMRMRADVERGADPMTVARTAIKREEARNGKR